MIRLENNNIATVRETARRILEAANRDIVSRGEQRYYEYLSKQLGQLVSEFGIDYDKIVDTLGYEVAEQFLSGLPFTLTFTGDTTVIMVKDKSVKCDGPEKFMRREVTATWRGM